MDRIKLKKNLEQEIAHYLNIPYFINFPKNPHQRLAVQVSKGNWQQVQKYTARLAKKENVKLSALTSRQLYNFQKKHHIGIDCSGLVYHLLDFLYQQSHHQSIRFKLIGAEGKTSPRRLSAHLLTSLPNAVPITPDQILPGDLIRSLYGRHVMFVIKKTTKGLKVVDSSRQGRGVRISLIPLPLPPKSSLHRLKCLISPPTIPPL